MNYQDFIFLDFETTGRNPFTCQPTQLAAVVIDGRKLEIKESNVFKSYIAPIWDEEECEKLGLTPVNDEACEKSNITREMLQDAPSLKSVWKKFEQYVFRHNPKKSKWGAPIKAGMNIERYDAIIIDRICGGHFGKARNELDKMLAGGIIEKGVAAAVKKIEPYGLGPWDDDRQEETLFYPRDCVDLMRIIWMWTENMPEIKSLSMDAVREWLGIDAEGAHTADKDVLDGAKVLVKFLKLHRNYATKIKFRDSFKK